MRKALENAHPQFQPQFVPSFKTEGYADLLQMLKVNPPKDCTEPECELCRFRRQLPVTPKSPSQIGAVFVSNMTTVTKHMVDLKPTGAFYRSVLIDPVSLPFPEPLPSH